jgi:hypothetical protein
LGPVFDYVNHIKVRVFQVLDSFDRIQNNLSYLGIGSLIHFRQ